MARNHGSVVRGLPGIRGDGGHYGRVNESTEDRGIWGCFDIRKIHDRVLLALARRRVECRGVQQLRGQTEVREPVINSSGRRRDNRELYVEDVPAVLVRRQTPPG